jgi:hypothetical protein
MQNATASPSEGKTKFAMFSSEVLVRFALVPIAVASCYCFRWEMLRYLSSEANLRLDLLAGLHLQRLSIDTVQWRGSVYQYENACTFIDVWFGSIPLLWNLGRPVAANLRFFAGLALALFAFNIFRLSFSDLLFSAGLPWDLAHNAVSGIAYFAVWVWIWRHRPFLRTSQVPCPLPSSPSEYNVTRKLSL